MRWDGHALVQVDEGGAEDGKLPERNAGFQHGRIVACKLHS